MKGRTLRTPRLCDSPNARHIHNTPLPRCDFLEPLHRSAPREADWCAAITICNSRFEQEMGTSTANYQKNVRLQWDFVLESYKRTRPSRQREHLRGRERPFLRHCKSAGPNPFPAESPVFDLAPI